MIHPECVYEWAKALNLSIEAEQYKQYAVKMVNSDELVGASLLISRFNLQNQFDIGDILIRLIEDHQRLDTAKNLVQGHKQF